MKATVPQNELLSLIKTSILQCAIIILEVKEKVKLHNLEAF